MMFNDTFSRVFVTLTLSAALLGASNVATVAAENDVYLFAYFTGPWPSGGSSGVYLSYSTDGLDFQPINNGNPVFTSPQPPAFPSGENQTRDPSVVLGPDGKFHMVWTSGITTKTIGYSSSTDLKSWSPAERITLWNAAENVANTWAPEIFYDAAEEEYVVAWASNLNGGDHRLYYFTTPDFDTISPKELLYYNGNTVIDGAIAFNDATNKYVMAIKDERNGLKNLWLATSDSATGPYTPGVSPIIGPGSPVDAANAVEGPSLVKIDDLWYLYYDRYGAGQLSVATSPDLVTWTLRYNEANLPLGHHGTVFAAPATSVAWLVEMTSRSDLNGDDAINAQDWEVFRTNHRTDLTDYSPAERAARGDLDGDGDNDFADFRQFQADYKLMVGPTGYAALFGGGVPEPASGSMVVGCAALLCCQARSRYVQPPCINSCAE
jgi:hypothetical protein